MKRQHPENPDLVWCSKCKTFQEVEDFRGSQCKHCKAKYDVEYRKRNAEKLKEKRQKYHAEHATEMTEKTRAWRAQNPIKSKELNLKVSRNWREKNVDKLRKREKAYRDGLNKGYIKRLIKQRKDEIPITPDLIELVRLQTIARRTMTDFKKWQLMVNPKEPNWRREHPDDKNLLWCPMCKKYKPMICFNIDKHNKKYGRAGYCSDCNKINKKEYYKKKREES